MSAVRARTARRSRKKAAASALVARVRVSHQTTQRPLTRAQLIAKADPICQTVVAKEDYSSISPARVIRYASELAAVQQHAYERLSQLTPPASMADDWQLILDGFHDSARDFRVLGKASPSESSRFEQLYGDVRKKAWIAREDGFKDCGRY